MTSSALTTTLPRAGSGPAQPGRILVEQVSLVYSGRSGDTRALDRVDLVIEPGELVCLVGPSGCGKTSLLRLLAGVVEPSEGRITIAGDEASGPGPDRGLVLQQPTLFPWLTAAQNVELGPRLLGASRAERRRVAQEHLELVGLGDVGDRAVWELSGGMQQRCAIARALATEPGILLMDEPFGALDEFTRERLQLELTRIWQATGKTIVFVTHSIEEAVVLGSRVITLGTNPGRVVDDHAIDLPWPRSRTDEAVTRVRRHVAERLYRSEDR